MQFRASNDLHERLLAQRRSARRGSTVMVCSFRLVPCVSKDYPQDISVSARGHSPRRGSQPSFTVSLLAAQGQICLFLRDHTMYDKSAVTDNSPTAESNLACNHCQIATCRNELASELAEGRHRLACQRKGTRDKHRSSLRLSFRLLQTLTQEIDGLIHYDSLYG